MLSSTSQEIRFSDDEGVFGDTRKGGLGPCFGVCPSFSYGEGGSLGLLGVGMSRLPAVLPIGKPAPVVIVSRGTSALSG